MKIIIALGNPGTKYEKTRHNVGWLILDLLIAGFELQNTNWQNKFNSEILETSIKGQKFIFMKPQTFMNESGTAVKSIIDFYKLDPSRDILVLHDEVDLPFGTIRSTDSSSSAGQNGVQDIIDKLGSQNFHRTRIGVETRASRTEMDTKDFVLSNFSDEEIKKLQEEVFPKVKLEISRFVDKN